MTAAPIVLVPGFWLGAWAWDDVAALLRADGHDVTALTLPGLESPDSDRTSVRLEDHVAAICAALQAAPAPAVLALHSGAGFPGYAATDRMPERVAAAVYVDTGPGKGAMKPDFAGAELALAPWDELGESLEHLTEEQLAEFRRRAVPQPGAALRNAVELTNPARLDIPSTVMCTSFPSSVIKQAVADGQDWLAGIAELRDVAWVDEPTSHWPMWSRPREVAALLSEVAQRHAPR